MGSGRGLALPGFGNCARAVFLLFILSIFPFTNTTAQTSQIDQLLEQAIDLQERGKFKAALKKVEQVLATDANNLLGQLERAYVLLAMKKYRQALLQSELTLRTQPPAGELYMAYVNKGNALSYLGSLHEAVAAARGGRVHGHRSEAAVGAREGRGVRHRGVT